ncbi:2OG-Fe(II) oxygenase [Thalassospira mesophila]|uniref:2OG-Fe(II) oxygenase n=1 Tax=Thalassospira mesophila TaxID=1293891 RepID=UPI00117F7F00|nr:2OG-Fe(II) oxygenase [Thalassospira mesophila]
MKKPAAAAASAAPATKASAQPVLACYKGDPVPRIALPGLDGKPVDLTDQRIAGDSLVLWVGPDLPSPDDFKVASGFAEQMSGANIRLYRVIVGTKASLSDDFLAAIPDFVTVLFDPENRLMPVFDITTTSFIAIRPDGRLGGVFSSTTPMNGFEMAMGYFQANHDIVPFSIIQRQAPVLVVDNVLEPALCEQLLTYWRTGDKQANGVSIGSQSNQSGDTAIKVRNDVVLLDQKLFDAVKNRIIKRVLPEIFKAFQFQTASMEALRIGSYHSNDKGFFGRHRDNKTTFTAHRRFAVSLNLNPVTYEGGQVNFPEYGQALYAPPQGGALIFSCSLLHEARPVTQGERFGIFTFLTDAAGARHEQEMIAKNRGTVQPLNMKK